MIRARSRINFRALFLATAVTTLFTICGCENAKPPSSAAADAASIRNLDAEWSKAAGAHDIDKTVSYYAESAYLLAPGEALANNQAAIRASWRGLLATASTISWQPVEIEANDNIAYAVGTYSAMMKDGKGGEIADHGKFLEVWRKTGPDEWKCVGDSYSSDMPAPK